MGDMRVEGGELKKLVKSAKKGPVAFGFNPGKSEEDAYFAMDRRKSPEVVGKDAKDGGEGGKFAFGTAKVSAKIITLTCQRELPGLAKRLKKYLKSQKVMLNVVILDADGKELESDIEDNLPDDPDLDGEDEDDAPEAEAEEATPPAAPPKPEAGEDVKRLTADLGALRKEIGAVTGPAAEALTKVFVQLVGALKAGDTATVTAGIEKVRGALAKVAAGPSPQAAAAQAAGKDADALDNQIAGIRDPSIRPRLEAAMAQVRKLIGEDPGKAQAALARVRDALARTAAGGPSKPRLSGAPLRGFLDARDAASTQIGKLQDALRGVGHPALQELADKGFSGITGRLQVGLQVALMEVDSAAPADRPKAVTKAVQAVEAFKAMLATDPVIPLLEDNPFGVAVSLRQDIGAALDTIRQGLDA